jgi:tetratricopeptide (TPR) repeat protein
MNRITYLLLSAFVLGPAALGAEPPPPPTPALPANAAAPKQESPESYSPGAAMPKEGSAWIHPTPTPPPVRVPQTYPATHAEDAARVDDLNRRAAALVAEGNLQKAMELYNESLRLAPQHAETFRLRAIALLRLGDRVQAQVDYARFLALDPQALGRLREEIQLFGNSGFAQVGETVVVPPGVPPAVSPGAVGVPPVPLVEQRPFGPAEQSDVHFAVARDEFMRGNYRTAYQWAQRAARIMPQARLHAIMAQALLAQGSYRAAADEARAAVTMGPLIEWTTLYGYYDYQRTPFDKQFHALEEYVRQNPSSPGGRFLIGYEYLILGQTELAHAQLAIAAVLDPLDVVPRSLLAREGVEIVRGEHSMTTSLPRRDATGVVVASGARRAGQPPLAAAASRKEVQR